MANGDIGFAAAKLHQSRVGIDQQIHIGMRVLELRQMRHQPAAGKTRLRADLQRARKLVPRERLQAVTDHVEGRCQHRKQRPSLGRQADAAVAPLEQRSSDKVFQLTNLPADRGLGDEKLARGQREAFEPARRLETPQRCQGQTAALHA
ncbi:hypothetical protein D3C87_1616370 [compost metagenome]